jgi:hypothetical protein
MPSIINSDSGATSGSAGFKFAATDDGILEIQNSGNTAISISPEGIATFAQPPLTAMPAFRGESTALQNVTSGTPTKVAIDSVSATNCFDTNSWFDTSNNRYVPQIAGYYQFKGSIYVSGTSQTVQAVYIYKNGVRYGGSTLLGISTSATQFINVVELVYMNGTTDYAELWGSITATSPQFNFAAPFTSSFEGFLVRAA